MEDTLKDEREQRVELLRHRAEREENAWTGESASGATVLSARNGSPVPTPRPATVAAPEPSSSVNLTTNARSGNGSKHKPSPVEDNPAPTEKPKDSKAVTKPIVPAARPLAKEAVQSNVGRKPGTPSLSTWLRESRRFFADAFGPQAGCITVTLKDAAGHIITYTVPDDLLAGTAPKLSELEQDIIAIVGRSTLPALTIASRLGHSNHAYIRTILAQMVEDGILAKSPYGYCLP